MGNPWLGDLPFHISNRYLLFSYIPSAYVQTFHRNDIEFSSDLLEHSLLFLEDFVLEKVYLVGMERVIGIFLDLLDMGKGFVIL